MYLGYGLRLSGRGSASVTPPDPSYFPDTLFGSESGDWWAASLAGSRWQDTKGGTPATDPDDPIGTWSGRVNDVNWSQGTSGRRPLYKTPSGLHRIDFDSADDVLVLGQNITSGTWTLAFSYTPIGEDFLVAFRSVSTHLLPGISGSSSKVLTGGTSSLNSVYFNNSLFTGTTRGEVFTAAQAARSIIIDWTPGSNWIFLQIGYYDATAPGPIGNIHAAFIINRSLTSGERSDLHDYLAAEAGL